MATQPDPYAWIQSPADAAHTGPTRASNPRCIIMHATAGTNSVQWLSTQSVPPVSAHLLITKTGQIHRIVPDAKVAYHAGVSKLYPWPKDGSQSLNNVSIGIELENLDTPTDPYPGMQVAAAAFAVYRLWKIYGAIPVFTHAQVAIGRKKDPEFFPWDGFWAYLRQHLQMQTPWQT